MPDAVFPRRPQTPDRTHHPHVGSNEPINQATRQRMTSHGPDTRREPSIQRPDCGAYSLHQLFAPAENGEAQEILSSGRFTRTRRDDAGKATALLDRFPDAEGVSCCFVRLQRGEARTISFIAEGAYLLEACPSGGWLLKAVQTESPSYWVPQAPILRTLDDHGHITSERPASVVGLRASPTEMVVELQLPANWCLDWVCWRIEPSESDILDALQGTISLEQERYFLWGSKVSFQLPADVYLYLLHGHVYTNDFVWPRKWKFCSEIDAYGLYLALHGLELATRKKFYGLLKRQILYSVIARQAQDGGWYQGEWTDLMESHYRLHNSAMLMLEAGLEEEADETIRRALGKAAAFLVSCTDQTDIGLWFLHDSLEGSVETMEEMRRQTRTPWIPSRALGKSPTNKLILNTHLDAIVALDRYRVVTGDDQYSGQIDSARAATRSVLGLRPAEPLYRFLYWFIGLTLLPKADAMRLPLPLRVIKRLTWMYLTPQMHRVKRIFPRLVMPGGLIERHLSPLHYDINYHPVNVMDLVRYWRRFPADDLSTVIDGGVKAVVDNHLLDYWSEEKPRQFAIVVWADALYHLCTLRPDRAYRGYLAQAMLKAQELGLGLPPSLLGGDTEVASPVEQQPCPSPSNARLMVANLSTGKTTEILVVNPTSGGLELAWECNAIAPLTWTDSSGQPVPGSGSSLMVPGRSWIQGRGGKLDGE